MPLLACILVWSHMLVILWDTNPENPDQISGSELYEVFLLRHPVCCILMNEIDKFVNRFVGKILA